MDLNTREGLESKEDKCNEMLKKSCVDCQTTRTPCWRSGPAGPRTLCNACGIRQRKKKRAVVGLDKGAGAEKRKNKRNRNRGRKIGVSFELMGFGRDRLLQRKLGEEEKAAFLLMALSCGSAYT